MGEKINQHTILAGICELGHLGYQDEGRGIIQALK
jgi:hypothetical protein